MPAGVPAEAAGIPGSYAGEVLELVDAVPAGRALTYGDVAELLGWGSARSVGAALARHGGAVPWWRVVRADGTLPPGLAGRAAGHWRAEGMPVRGSRIDLARARWDAAGWAPGPAPDCQGSVAPSSP